MNNCALDMVAQGKGYWRKAYCPRCKLSPKERTKDRCPPVKEQKT